MLAKKRIIQILLIGFFIFFAATRLIFFRPLFFEQICSIIIYPVLQLSSHCSAYIKTSLLKKKNYQQLVTAHHDLQNKYEALLENYIKSEATKNYHNKIYELLDFQKRYELTNAMPASIILKQLTEHEHTFFINRGSHHAVTTDMIAIYKLQIIGKVVEVFNFYSKIMLITDKRSKIAAFTNTTNAKGILQGTNNTSCCQLIYITNLSQIIDNDLVFSSGQGLVFPEGFCLGLISEHHLTNRDVYHVINVKPLIDLAKIDNCLLTNQSKISLL